MLDQFKGYIKYTKNEYEDLWSQSIIVVDTNILLYFYKYPSKILAERLLDILRRFQMIHRLWIPHQVALEYFFNYEKNMYNQKEGYEKIEENLKGLINTANSLITESQQENPFIKIEDFNFFIENLEKSNKQLEEKIKEEIDDLPDSNEIHESILELLKNNTGDPYDQNEIDKIEREGNERYKFNIPPGFKDKDDKGKLKHRSYGGVTYQQLYGDLIVWQQIIDKIKELENPKHVIFITEDNKEDWWHRKKGRTIGPHPNLIQEFFNETGKNFYMYNTVRFMEYASKYFNIEFDADQLSEVSAELESIRTAEESMKSDYNQYYKQKKYKNLNEKNYKNFINNSNISIKKILNFLPANEIAQSKDLISNALHDSNNERVDYNEAIVQIFNRAIPYLEQRAKELSTEIEIEGYPVSGKFLLILDALPTNIIEKGIELIKLIDEMEIYLKNDGLPF